MDERARKHQIEDALKALPDGPFGEGALRLLEALGYKSTRRPKAMSAEPKDFLAVLPESKSLNHKLAQPDRWHSIQVLLQLTGDEVRDTQQARFQFEDAGKWEKSLFESYVFLAIELKSGHYTRTDLACMTRALNRLFVMPAMVLFRLDGTLTFSVIDRRLHKRDTTKDVLEKVTLIKDIRLANPHRAHIEILHDLHIEELRSKHEFTSFQGLHDAWRKTLDISELNRRFYREIANWYFWALKHIRFPKGAPKSEGRDHVSAIRMITRLLFCWFIKEKGLIPDALFDRRMLERVLAGFAPDTHRDSNSVYYRAILQNLFFATLDTEMDKRGWAREGQHFMAHSLYRFRECFREPERALDLFRTIPFLNGGLFECLDKDFGEGVSPRYVRVDGFSRRSDSQPCVPDFLFFGSKDEVDLSDDYGDSKYRRTSVRGLFRTFEDYKFTVAENTPVEEEVALDPELSGRVFENLLASFNPETQVTARKETGSYFTPRPIVEYMVDEALIACLNTKLTAGIPSAKDTESRLRHLFSYSTERHQFRPLETAALVAAIDDLKVLDPAVGSGAFPMGILHKLVHVLGKLDPHNAAWREKQIAKVAEIPDCTVRDRAIADIEHAFERNELDYGRKLFLIENCVYGVDIQPIAVQIAKMRFFISLIVDQKLDEAAPNRGIRPLPNLETKFVAANTLISIDRPKQTSLRNPDIDRLERVLADVRRQHFTARSLKTKRALRDRDKTLRAEVAAMLKKDGWRDDTARMLAAWDPYNQNAAAGFFDLEWMFGIRSGVDVVIGNPPYIRSVTLREADSEEWLYCKRKYTVASSKEWDIYLVFAERGLGLLSSGGTLAYILPNKFLNSQVGENLRVLIAKGRHLSKLVHFGAYQVFAGETTYTCLLFLNQAGVCESEIHRLRDAGCLNGTVNLPPEISPENWASSRIAAGTLGGDPWVFSLTGGNLLARLNSYKKLNSVAVVFQGTGTRADKVYLVEKCGQSGGLVRVLSSHTGEVHLLERHFLKPALRGRSIARYGIDDEDRLQLIVPYELRADSCVAVSEERLRSIAPRTLAYLKKCKPRLDEREDGRFKHRADWYAYGYPRSMTRFDRLKIVIPDVCNRGKCWLEDRPHWLIDTAYGLLAKDGGADLHYLLALLNSPMLTYFLKETGTPLRGGYFRMKTAYLDPFPIPDLDLSHRVHRTQHDRVVELVGVMLRLHKELRESKTASEQESVRAQIAATDGEIDRLVYDLYGLTEDEIAIVEGRR